jgi:hypothetical protein
VNISGALTAVQQENLAGTNCNELVERRNQTVRSSSFRQDEENSQIIIMGLPKSGTTAAATALKHAGFRVAHHQGDRLGPQCDVLANTMEDGFRDLHALHPSASWMVLRSDNTSAWLDSVANHVAQPKNKRQCTKHTVKPGLSCWRGDTVGSIEVGCTFYGCSEGMPEGDRKTLHVQLHETERILKAHDTYYARLTKFLESVGKSYAVVDVRNGVYRSVHELISPNITIPFAAVNTRHHRGGEHVAFPHC